MYRAFRDGGLVDEVANVKAFWQDDVAYLIVADIRSLGSAAPTQVCTLEFFM
ncbi:MAG: hypothetical protein AAF346_04975 [Pseudomonadota bacterium]